VRKASETVGFSIKGNFHHIQTLSGEPYGWLAGNRPFIKHLIYQFLCLLLKAL